MNVRSIANRALVALVLVSAAGCAAGTMQKPINVGDTDTGAGSVTAARKFLEGRWTLESFEVFPPGKPPIMVTGTGTMNYDDFGNLRIDIRAGEKESDMLRAAGIDIRDGLISSDGRATVDMQNRTISYVLTGQQVGKPGAGPLAPGRLRYWEVKDDLLYLSTRDEAGKTSSMARWKKMP